MEHDEPMSESPIFDYSTTVDTSRPFTSVKEAVAIFGERILVGEIYSPSPSPTPKPFSFSETTTTPTPYYSPSVSIKREPSWKSMPSSPSPSPISPIKSLSFKEEENINNNSNSLFDTVKKLEEELEKTKRELKILKERGSETEVALATLNAELHKNMSKLAEAEAEAAGKAASKTVRFENIVEREKNIHKNSNADGKRMGNSQTLAHIISLGENDHIFGGKKRNNNNNKITKQKPIVPLVGDLFLFFKRKSSSTNHHNNPLYASPF